METATAYDGSSSQECGNKRRVIKTNNPEILYEPPSSEIISAVAMPDAR
jgi:hypothetical protein